MKNAMLCLHLLADYRPVLEADRSDDLDDGVVLLKIESMGYLFGP